MTGAIQKARFSATELAAMKLPGLPGSERGIRFMAERDEWAYVEVPGKGGPTGLRREYTVPQAVLKAIREKVAADLLQAGTPQAVGPYEVAVNAGVKGIQPALPGFAESERQIADARKGVLLAVQRLMAGSGCTQKDVITTLLVQARAGQVDAQLLAMLRSASTGRGRGAGRDLPGFRTLMRWLSADRRHDLAPKRIEQDMQLPEWAAVFLAYYRQPTKPTVTEAYAKFRDDWEGPEEDGVSRLAPSIHAVRRFMSKLPADLLYAGRNTGAALKALLPYVKRDWSVLRPNDVWIGDGHSLKAKVAHPDHGRPFTPEVTLIVDGASRLVVGWSVSLSENQLAVSDAIRHGVVCYGKPLIYYSDNGAGQTAKTLDDPMLGVLPRLSIHHETGIPGNPQGRGIIERIWQTITLSLAREFDTYQGAGMDREVLRKTSREIESALKRQVQAPKLATWAQFIDQLGQALHAYNTTHQHRSLAFNGSLLIARANYRIDGSRIGGGVYAELELADPAAFAVEAGLRASPIQRALTGKDGAADGRGGKENGRKADPWEGQF